MNSSRLIGALVLSLLCGSLASAQSAVTLGGLLQGGFEIKAATYDLIILQKGTQAYVCKMPQKVTDDLSKASCWKMHS